MSRADAGLGAPLRLHLTIEAICTLHGEADDISHIGSFGSMSRGNGRRMRLI